MFQYKHYLYLMLFGSNYNTHIDLHAILQILNNMSLQSSLENIKNSKHIVQFFSLIF